MEKEQATYSRFQVVLFVVFFALALICCTVVPFLLDHIRDVDMQEQQEREASIRAHYYEHNQSVSTFPHQLTIYDKTAYLRSVDMLEFYGNHSYTGYVIITIDRGQLTDDDMYWIFKGERNKWELDARASLFFIGTDRDNISLRLLGCRYTDNHIYFIFYSDPQRQSLRGCTFHISLEYLQDGADDNDRYTYTYHCDFSGGDYHDSTEFLPEGTLKFLAEVMIDAVS